MFSRSFRLPTRLPVIPITRCMSTSTHSYMDRPKQPSPTGSVEPSMSMSAREMDDDFAQTNSDADSPSQQSRQSANMSMMDEQAKEKVEMSAKDDWTFEAEAMSQDIHSSSSRIQKPSPYTDYM
jgi:hypothetical protein